MLPPADPQALQMGTGTSAPISTTPEVLSPASPLNLELSRDDLLPLPVRPPNPPPTTPSPDPTPNPNIKPKIEQTDNTPSRGPTPPTTADPRSLQTPEASVPPQSQGCACGWQEGVSRRGQGQGRG
uniref:Uncharacterized protein n=1 Tax=Moniliophthora roreri TaxID=221103 RepID=A0A0W0FQ47_MONRR